MSEDDAFTDAAPTADCAYGGRFSGDSRTSGWNNPCSPEPETQDPQLATHCCRRHADLIREIRGEQA